MADEQVATQETPEVVETQEPVEQAEPETPVAVVEPAKPEPTELERKLQAAEREAERHRKRADYWMQNYQKVTPPAVEAKPDPEPVEDAFGTDTLAYAKAWAAWNAREAVRQDRVQQTEVSQKQVAEAQKQAVVQERLERIQEASAADPQIWTACDSLGNMGVVIGTPIQDALFESDNFAGLVKHLAAHPQEVQRIMALPPVRQVKEITRIESQLSKAPAPPPLRATQATPPARPVNGASASVKAIDLNDPNLPIEVWQKEFIRLDNLKRAQSK